MIKVWYNWPRGRTKQREAGPGGVGRVVNQVISHRIMAASPIASQFGLRCVTVRETQ